MEATVERARREEAVVLAATGATAVTDASPRAEVQEEPAVPAALAAKVARVVAERAVLHSQFTEPTPWSLFRATNFPTGAAALVDHLRVMVVRQAHRAM